MGRWSSANNGQRVTFLITEVIMRRAEEGGWGKRAGVRYKSLHKWISEREKSIGKGQERIVHVVQYQEELFAVVIGEEATANTEKLLRHIVQEELRVQINDKEEMRRPFSSKFGVIGATYDVGELSRLRASPTDFFKAKLKETTRKMEEWKGRAAPKKVVQKCVGLRIAPVNHRIREG